MTFCVVPEGLAAHSAAVEALTTSAGLNVSPTADPVSLSTAARFSSAGGEHAIVAGQGVQELGRSGVGVGESRTTVMPPVIGAAASYLIGGGGR